MAATPSKVSTQEHGQHGKNDPHEARHRLSGGKGEAVKVVYIAGPFRAATPWLVEANVRRAEEVALAVWRLGIPFFVDIAHLREWLVKS